MSIPPPLGQGMVASVQLALDQSLRVGKSITTLEALTKRAMYRRFRRACGRDLK